MKLSWFIRFFETIADLLERPDFALATFGTAAVAGSWSLEGHAGAPPSRSMSREVRSWSWSALPSLVRSDPTALALKVPKT